MPYSDFFSISAVGMDIERLRLDLAAMNLANSRVAMSPAGDGYRPLRMVAVRASASSVGNFEQWMQAPKVRVEAMDMPPQKVLEPGHPLADAMGFVKYPAVDHTQEMVTIMTAVRAYEANVAALNMSRSMVLKALEIGGAH